MAGAYLTVQSKQCRTCKRILTLDCFDPNPPRLNGESGGRRKTCRECRERSRSLTSQRINTAIPRLCACGCGQPSRGIYKVGHNPIPAGNYRVPKELARTERDAEQRRAAASRLYQRKRVRFDEFMQGRVCERCGDDGSLRGRLEWHHRDPATKFMNVVVMMSSYSWERVMGEIAKCELLCTTCHHEIHWRMRRQKRQTT